MLTRPDNGVYPSTIRSNDIDNAELAARLGINRLRRSGRVVFYDDFSNGLSWVTVGTINAIYTYYLGEAPLIPPGMFVLSPQVASGSCSINTFIPAISESKMGIEFTFKFPYANLPHIPSSIEFRLRYNGCDFAIRWLCGSTENIQYLNSVNVFANLINYPHIPFWQNWKLVIDTNTKTYEYIQTNGTDTLIRLAAYANVGVGSNSGHLQLAVTQGANLDTGLIIDNIIVTSDESLR